MESQATNGRNFTWSDWSSSKIGLHCLVRVSNHQTIKVDQTTFLCSNKKINNNRLLGGKWSDSQFTCFFFLSSPPKKVNTTTSKPKIQSFFLEAPITSRQHRPSEGGCCQISQKARGGGVLKIGYVAMVLLWLHTFLSWICELLFDANQMQHIFSVQDGLVGLNDINCHNMHFATKTAL